MGFGTLFVGYFFLTNISYYGYTDVISAMIMTIALYKLSSVNKDFYHGFISSSVFALFSLGELTLCALELFLPSISAGAVGQYISAARQVLIFITTYFILTGIAAVAKEVGDATLCERARRMKIISTSILLVAIFELPFVASVLEGAAGYVMLFLVLLYLVTVALVLITIYRAYMGICMPEDNLPKEEKPSKLAFVNRFREHERQKNLEWAEYKLEKAKQRDEKRKKSKKK